ncbi:hypothetical protein PC128_g21089 [Phytophthora cactorum]|nr:hypothetical protein PC128_g21089 [Phytophthora cactorum]
MEIDAIEASNDRRRSAYRGGGGRTIRPLTCEGSPRGGMSRARSGAGRPTGFNKGPGPPVAARPSSAPVLRAHFNATTAPSDTRLSIVSLHVPGAQRPLRALLDSGAPSNFFRVSCLPELPKSARVRKGPGEVEVKLSDGKPRRVTRHEVSLPYTFDGFRSKDDFLMIEMNYAFDCILGIPWLARYQPDIGWLARSVKRRRGFDVSEVFTHLLVAPRDWPHVTVVDKTATTRAVHRASDGPLCMACALLLNEESSQRCGANEKAIEQGVLPHTTSAVECGLPLANAAVEHGFPPKYEMAVERGLPQMNNTAVEQKFPPDDLAGLPCLEEGEASSSDSDSSSTSSRSRRKKKKSKRRRLKPRREPISSESPPMDSVCALEYVEGAPRWSRFIKVASPPRDAASITRLPGLSWKHFLRDLKAGEIEQVCLITEEPSAAEALNATMTES